MTFFTLCWQKPFCPGARLCPRTEARSPRSARAGTGRNGARPIAPPAQNDVTSRFGLPRESRKFHGPDINDLTHVLIEILQSTLNIADG